MHLYFYLRGIKQQVDLWVTLAQGQFWRWDRKNLKTKKIDSILVQGALRPSVFGAWEYIFPEECLAEVIAAFGVADNSLGTTPTRKNKAKIAMLRKPFGAKKIAKAIYEEAKKIPKSLIIKDYWRGLSSVAVPGVAIHIIGYKKDARRKMEQWGYEQEML